MSERVSVFWNCIITKLNTSTSQSTNIARMLLFMSFWTFSMKSVEGLFFTCSKGGKKLQRLSALHLLILESSVKARYIMPKLKPCVTEDTLITHLPYSFKIKNARILLIFL